MQLITKLETFTMNLTGCDKWVANLIVKSIIKEVDATNREEIYEWTKEKTAKEILDLIIQQTLEIPGDVLTHKNSRIDELAILAINIVKKYLGGVKSE